MPPVAALAYDVIYLLYCMMKKTILALALALSVTGVGVFAQGDGAAAKKEPDTKTTVKKDAKTPEALGMDMSKHSTAHVPQGGTPKSAQKPVGVVKN